MRKFAFTMISAVALAGLFATDGSVVAQSTSAEMIPLNQMGARLAALVRPGQWSGTTQEFKPDGTAKGPPEADIPACMTTKQAAENFGAIFEALAMLQDMPGCKLLESQIQGGAARANIQCNIDGKRLNMSFNGQFGPDRFEFTMKNDANDFDVEKSGSMHATAKRTGDC